MSYRFRLPPSRHERPDPWFVLLSALVHLGLIALVVVASRRTFEVVTFVTLGGVGDAQREVQLPALPGGPVAGRVPGRTGDRTDTAATQPREVALVAPREVPTGIPPDGQGEAVPERGLPGGEEALDEERGEVGRPGALGPRFGDGRLWVRPRDAIAAAIAGAFDDAPAGPATHVARLDSAVAARIYAYLDTIPRDSMAPTRPPSWTTEINGQTWGIDGSWIYLGGLKLPTAILALLPLQQGNYEQAQRAAELQRIREDILQAARRAETADQFRRYVEETRQRREAERERQRNQRVPPDSIKT